jgi:hypothetical protein
VYRTRRCLVCQLLNRGADPVPSVRAVVVAISRELIGTVNSFLEGM